MARWSRVDAGRSALRRLRISAVIASALLPSCGGDDGESAPGTAATSLSPASIVNTSPTAPQATGLETFPPVGTDAPDGGGGSGLGLPDGPEGPGEDRDRDVYSALREGRCERAAENLDRHWDKVRSPRDVLIYQAAIEVCRGDRAQAARWLAAATAMGLEGLVVPVATRNSQGDHVVFAWYCEVYRSVRSVLEGGGRDAFVCPDGVPPAWPSGERDDPRTPEDESTAISVGDDTTSATHAATLDPSSTTSSTPEPPSVPPSSSVPPASAPPETTPSVTADSG